MMEKSQRNQHVQKKVLKHILVQHVVIQKQKNFLHLDMIILLNGQLIGMRRVQKQEVNHIIVLSVMRKQRSPLFHL